MHLLLSMRDIPFKFFSNYSKFVHGYSTKVLTVEAYYRREEKSE